MYLLRELSSTHHNPERAGGTHFSAVGVTWQAACPRRRRRQRRPVVPLTSGFRLRLLRACRTMILVTKIAPPLPAQERKARMTRAQARSDRGKAGRAAAALPEGRTRSKSRRLHCELQAAASVRSGLAWVCAAIALLGLGAIV